MALPALLTQMLIDTPLAIWPLTDVVGASSVAEINPSESGPTYPGTPTAVTFGSSGPVSGLKAALFNGTTSKIAIPFARALAPPGAFTMEVWFSSPSNPGVASLLFGDSDTTLLKGGRLYLGTSGQVIFDVNSGSAGVSSALSTGTFHNAIGTYDGTSTRLSIDGSLVAGPTAGPYTPNDGSQGLFLGVQSGSSNFFNGTLALCALYNYALSSRQIANHYAAWQAATPEYYFPFPSGFQPWDVAGFGSVDGWFTEVYQGAGFGQPPALRQSALVALVQGGSPAIKYWTLPSAVNPLG